MVSIHALRMVQQQLEALYVLEPGPNIAEYVRAVPHAAHEYLLVRESEGTMEVALELPASCLVLNARALPRYPTSDWLELVEGVSHFVHVAERARTDLPTTLLELELQAEVDKFVLLAWGRPAAGLTRMEPYEAWSLYTRLFDCVFYLHPPGTTLGDRYRTASNLAARFVARLLAKPSNETVLAMLRRFYRCGQADKVWLANAA